MSGDQLVCFMCGKSFERSEAQQNADHKLVAGKHGKICDECVDICGQLIAEAKMTQRTSALLIGGVG